MSDYEQVTVDSPLGPITYIAPAGPVDNVVNLNDFRAPADEPLLTRRELQKKVGRGKSTIFAWIDEKMPVESRAAGGNRFRWSAVKRWLENEKGWTFDDASSVGLGHIPDPEEDRQHG